MTSLEDKSRYILEFEERFAYILATKVLNKPKLSLWMILIPFLLVFYMQSLQRYKTGLKAFADNYMTTPKLALEAAIAKLNQGEMLSLDTMPELKELSGEARQKLKELYDLLIEHYTDLLQKDGGSFEALVQSTYQNRTNYLLFLNQLNKAEKALNAALKPHLSMTTTGVNDIIRAIERYSEEIRRNTANLIFT